MARALTARITSAAQATDTVPAPTPSALEQLFLDEFDFVWRVLRRLGLSEAEADDAAQEVFLVVAHKLSGYQERGALRSWLFAIARMVARRAKRTDLRRQRGQQQLEPPAPAPDPERLAEARDLAALVQRFMDQLDPDQAMAFLLSEIEGLTAKEIAAALDIKLSTALGRIRLSRLRFEAFMRRHVPDEAGP